MITQDSFRPDFVKFVTTAGYEIRGDIFPLTIADPGGEIRFPITEVDGGYLVQRADRAEMPRSIMRAETLETVQRQFIMEFGMGARNALRLPKLFLPSMSLDLVAPGLKIVDTGNEWLSLKREDGSNFGIEFLDRGEPYSIVKFSYLVDAPFEQVLASFQAADGAPLFQRFVRA